MAKLELVYPVDLSKITVTSPYGMRNGRFHAGTDFRAPEGTPILAADDGTVIFSGHDNYGGGNHITIKHYHDDLLTFYMHHSALKVKKGAKVKAGQVIALSGHTGNCIPDNKNGAHLHFSIATQATSGNYPVHSKSFNPMGDKFKLTLKKDYLAFVPFWVTVIVDVLNIREGPDSHEYKDIGDYAKGTKVKILRLSVDREWGKTDKGWICVKPAYVKKVVK